eukprot:9207402-Alexandrium_andersonii.AAC.1
MPARARRPGQMRRNRTLELRHDCWRRGRMAAPVQTDAPPDPNAAAVAPSQGSTGSSAIRTRAAQ